MENHQLLQYVNYKTFSTFEQDNQEAIRKIQEEQKYLEQFLPDGMKPQFTKAKKNNQ